MTTPTFGADCKVDNRGGELADLYNCKCKLVVLDLQGGRLNILIIIQLSAGTDALKINTVHSGGTRGAEGAIPPPPRFQILCFRPLPPRFTCTTHWLEIISCATFNFFCLLEVHEDIYVYIATQSQVSHFVSLPPPQAVTCSFPTTVAMYTLTVHWCRKTVWARGAPIIMTK